MKPFDANAVKPGDTILVRMAGSFDARPKEYIGHFTRDDIFQVVYLHLGVPDWAPVTQIFMPPTKRTVYINLHKQRDTGEITPFLYGDEAYANRQRGSSMNCLGTFAIEIED